jgi:hypothetical protein
MRSKLLSATLVSLTLLGTGSAASVLAQEQVNPTQEQVNPTFTQKEDFQTLEDDSLNQEDDSLTQDEDTSPDNIPTISEVTAESELSVSDSATEELINENIINEVPLSEVQFNRKANNFREQAVKQAITEIGTQEKPLGSNCNKFSKYFGVNCRRWCADFVSWAFDYSGNRNKKVDWKNPGLVASILRWAKDNPNEGRIVKNPKVGDIFLIRKNGASHTGLVRSVSGTTFISVEGNTSNKVRTLKRPINKFQFVRVLHRQ